MNYTEIEVPDMNDSVSRLVLSGTPYIIRFTYNDTGDYWKFGLYSSMNDPIVIGIKIVPNFPLNAFYGVTKLPAGYFAVKTRLSHVGRNAYKEGKARFVFIPA